MRALPGCLSVFQTILTSFPSRHLPLAPTVLVSLIFDLCTKKRRESIDALNFASEDNSQSTPRHTFFDLLPQLRIRRLAFRRTHDNTVGDGADEHEGECGQTVAARRYNVSGRQPLARTVCSNEVKLNAVKSMLTMCSSLLLIEWNSILRTSQVKQRVLNKTVLSCIE